MAGQIERRGPRTFRLRWFLGRDTHTGKRRYGSKTVRGTKREADQALREILRQRDLGVLVESRSVALDHYLDQWLERSAALRLRERTVADYREILSRYVRPSLGAKRLDRLHPLDVQGMIRDLEARGLSPRTIRYAHSVLSGALRQAVRWRMIASNPCGLVDLPRRRPREMRALTPEEADAFRAAIAGTRFEALFLVLLATGIRPGEALGLCWDAVDLEAGRLAIRRTLARRKKGEEWRLEEPKTAKSRRVVPLPRPVVAALRSHRAAQAKERMALGAAYGERGLVFANEAGDPIDHRSIVRCHFKPALRRAELPQTIRLYDLRHSYASLALAAGAHVKVVSERLGHASTTMTLDVYSHVLPSMESDATERVEALLFGERAGSRGA